MLNQVQIIGFLGRDPDVRHLANGDAVCNFSIATTEKWKDKVTGEAKEATEWHRISTFGKLAEICSQYLKKGSLAFVQGKIQTRKYTDKDGVEKFSTEIKADAMKMLGGKPDGQESRPAQAPRQTETRQPTPSPSGFDDMSDDIPFITSAFSCDMTTSKARRMARYDYRGKHAG